MMNKLWIGICVAVHSLSFAQTADDIIVRLGQPLSKIQSLSYTVERQFAHDARISAELRWRENDRGEYHYVYKGYLPTGELKFTSERSYSSHIGHMDLLPADAYLLIYPEARPMPSEIQNMALITALWDAFGGALTEDFWRTPQLAVLKNGVVHSGAKWNLKILKLAEIAGRPCAVVSLQEAQSRLTSESKVNYEITIDLHTGLPIGWVESDRSGNILSRLTVGETQQAAKAGTQFHFPRKIRIEYFLPGHSKPDAPSSIADFTYSDLKINEASDEQMVIDVSRARTIYDTASKTTIDVPK